MNPPRQGPPEVDKHALWCTPDNPCSGGLCDGSVEGWLRRDGRCACPPQTCLEAGAPGCYFGRAPRTDRLVEVLAEHPRGDWSDRTYTCQGCSERDLAALEANETMPVQERRARYAKVSHPGWTLAEYHGHVAERVRAAGWRRQ